jgi:integrase
MTQKYGVHFAKRQLGHANVATTENYYIDQNLYTEKPTPDPDVELKARWNRYLEERKVVPK